MTATVLHLPPREPPQDNRPEPMVSAEVELRSLPYVPLHIRLFRSETWIKASVEARAVIPHLFAIAYTEQTPAGSLPDDDEVIAWLVHLDVAPWRTIRDEALHGWIKCRDGRLYHPFLAEIVNGVWPSSRAGTERVNRRWGTKQHTAQQQQRRKNARKTLAKRGQSASYKGQGRENPPSKRKGVPLPVVPPHEGGTARPPSSSLDERGRTAPDPATTIRDPLEIARRLSRSGGQIRPDGALSPKMRARIDAELMRIAVDAERSEGIRAKYWVPDSLVDELGRVVAGDHAPAWFVQKHAWMRVFGDQAGNSGAFDPAGRYFNSALVVAEEERLREGDETGHIRGVGGRGQRRIEEGGR
jgi:hypothetical protein